MKRLRDKPRTDMPTSSPRSKHQIATSVCGEKYAIAADEVKRCAKRKTR